MRPEEGHKAILAVQLRQVVQLLQLCSPASWSDLRPFGPCCVLRAASSTANVLQPVKRTINLARCILCKCLSTELSASAHSLTGSNPDASTLFKLQNLLVCLYKREAQLRLLFLHQVGPQA